ncbi:MAG TPA: glycosyltransferase family 2 protein [Thermoplasmata archaeon]|nr:glycosyltransferase family 2 protein [Thermoplasmata archaeon]
MRATLLVPTLNEAESIGHVLRSFRDAAAAANRELFRSDPLDWELLVVDGASTDGTAEIARAEGARVLVEPRKGYGRAYRTGFDAAKGEVLATMDGDATYPVATVPLLVQKLLTEQLDFVSGDRLSELDPKAMTTEHRLGNWVLNTFLRIAYAHYLVAVAGRTVRDSQSGMWVLRRSILPSLALTQDGMPLSEEIKLEVILRGYRFAEVPIHYAERWGAPKLSSWRDGRHNLLFLFRKRLEVARLKARGQLSHPAAAHAGERLPR